ncbi:MAG TPA: hypothetical protein H9891_04545 [Candidatus Salinicoccus stercoripullorum]|uniref:Uncharacterized protein n=1 Tax=Candidatus Salinicoccus stercoripullorum TaxID=2838756 RepID=A0A9D1U043_9STAP|nr:hypothetical protein [Candidatus Salinicoccus stercoripullorum]
MSYSMLFLVFAAFVFAIFAFAGVLSYFLTKALPGQDALVVDTPEEALERKI